MRRLIAAAIAVQLAVGCASSPEQPSMVEQFWEKPGATAEEVQLVKYQCSIDADLRAKPSGYGSTSGQAVLIMLLEHHQRKGFYAECLTAHGWILVSMSDRVRERSAILVGYACSGTRKIPGADCSLAPGLMIFSYESQAIANGMAVNLFRNGVRLFCLHAQETGQSETASVVHHVLSPEEQHEQTCAQIIADGWLDQLNEGLGLSP